MNTPATLGELVEFVMQNRRNTAFLNDGEEAIANNILRAAESRSLFYTKSNNNELTGILVCKEIRANKTVHIQNLLTIERSAIKQLAKKVEETWPEHQLTAFRKFKFIRYNTPKLIMKITTQPKGEVN